MKNNFVKYKTILSLLVAVCSALIGTGCSEELTVDESFTPEEINLIGQRHNEGLDAILNSAETHAVANMIRVKKSTNTGLTVEDKLEIARYLDGRAKEFISKNPITRNGQQIDIEPFNFTDEQLLEFFNSDIDTESSTQLQQKYFSLMEEVYFAHSNFDAIFIEEIDEVLEKAKAEIVNEGELIPVLTMGSVLKYSNDYWQTDLKYGGWLAIALADATNGGTAALWGSVAGPLGAVVVGLNGAIIGSCTAYLVGEI
jgi:hypothetical protein